MGPGLFKSSDGGVTWSAKNSGFQPNPLTGDHFPISKIVISPSNPSVIYFGTAVDNPITGPTGHIYKSSDGGESWQKVDGQHNIFGIYQIQGAVFDFDVNPQNSDIVYAGVAGQGVMKTSNGGTDWSTAYAAGPNIGEMDYFNVVRILPTQPNTVFFSGFTYYTADVLPGPPVAFETTGTEGLVPFPLRKSTDGGGTWNTVATPSSVALYTDLQFERASGNLYLSTIAYQTPIFIYFGNRGIFKSSDSGANWQAINNATFGSLDQMTFVALSANPSTVNKGIFASSGLGGLVVASTDTGSHWMRLDPSLLDAFVGTTAMAGNKLFVLTSIGIYLTDVTSLYAPATPAISSVWPATLPPSASPQLITIYGSNFLLPGDANASRLIFYDPANNPTPLRTPSSYVNSGRLDYNATLPVTGNWKVKVVNGSTESLPFSFTVSSGGIQLTGLSISGPASVNQNSSGQYSATAVFSDGSTPTVTPIWSVNVGAPASISTSGQLTAGSVSANTPVTITASYTTGGITKTASYNVTIVKTGNGGTQTQPLISNGGFESGNNGIWSANTLSGGTSGSADILQGPYPRSGGSWYAYVGDRTTTSVNALGSLYQFIDIPANATSIVLNFYLNIVTAEPGVGTTYDKMDVNLRTSSDVLIKKMRTFSEADKGANAPGNYSLVSIDLTSDLAAYAGQSIILQFYADTDPSYSTIFRIDDVSVTATVSTPVTPVLFSVSGYTSVAEGNTAQYNATVDYSDGSVASVTPSWSVSGPATISSSGLLTAWNVNSDTPATVTANYSGFGALNFNLTIINVAPVFSSLAISGPSSINENSSGQFTATAVFSDGSAVSASPSWSISSGPGSISSSGLLTVGEVSSDSTTTVSASTTIGGVMRSVTQQVSVINVSPPTLTSLSISGPSSLNDNSTALYSATAYFSDGSSQTVNPTWNEDSSVTSISIFGLLSAGWVAVNTSVTISASYTIGSVIAPATKAVTVIRTDTTAPTVTISSPTNGLSFSNSPITVSGTATDPGSPSSGVAAVQTRVNGGGWQTAGGTTSWSLSLALFPNNNFIEARSQDNAGSYSSNQSVTVTYIPRQYAITVSASPTNGGTVNGNGVYADGTTQTVTAAPSTGWRFLEWMEGQTMVSITNAYQFTLRTNRTLVADFVTNNAFGFKVSLDPDSTRGNFHGVLHLSFDTNAWIPSLIYPGSGTWNYHGGYFATFTNSASGDIANLNLYCISEEMAELSVQGSMAITPAGIGLVEYGPIGGGGGEFRPGTPNAGAFTGDEYRSVSGYQGNNCIVVVSNDFGFSLPIPWDGMSCNSTGTWWIRYTLTYPPPTHLALASMNKGNFLLTVSGQNAGYTLQVSTNLVNWTSANTFVIPADGSITLTNQMNSNIQQCYRVVLFP